MPLTTEPKTYLETLGSNHGHGRNMLAKADKAKVEIFFEPYREFSRAIDKDLQYAVDGLNKYLDFVDKHNPFTSQSKFAPTIIEEFLCCLLQNRFGNDVLRYGSVKAYSSLYFSYSGKEDFKKGVDVRINTKDQDVCIFKEESITTSGGIDQTIYIPLLGIACKTYLDKTMYDGSVATAAHIKTGNPHCLFVIVTQTYEVASSVDINLSQIDNIYVLRKQRKRGKTAINTIQADVVESLLEHIEVH